MSEKLSKDLKQWLKGMEEVKERYENLFTDIGRYVNPRRELIKDSQRYDDKGDIKGKKSYSGVPMGALGIWADGMQGHMVSQTLSWFKAAISDPFINSVDEVQKYLQQYDEAMYSEFNRSNFYAVLPEWFRDAGSIGTAPLYTEEDIGNGSCVHIPIHPREIFISKNRYGNVDAVFRKFFLTAKQALQKFGDACNEDIKKNAEDHPEKRHEFIHAVFPNKDRKFGSILSKDKPIASVYLQDKGPLKDPTNMVIRQSGYDVNPYAVWRLRKNSDEIYGYSPAADAMVNVKKDQQMSKTLLKAAQMAVEPALNVPEHMRGNTRITPSGQNYYERGGDIIQPIHTGINYPIAIDREEKIQRAIEDAYRVDFFLVLARAEREMTATEIMERQAEKSVLLGPQVDRLEQEGLSKVFSIVSDIADKGGRLPEPPQILIDLIEEAKESGKKYITIEPQYTGPLAQAQKQLFNMRPVKNFLNEMAQASVVVGTEILDGINPDRLRNKIVDSTNAPIDILRTPGEIKEVRDKRQADLEQQKMQQMMQGAAESYGKATSAPEDGSLAGQAMEGLGV